MTILGCGRTEAAQLGAPTRKGVLGRTVACDTNRINDKGVTMSHRIPLRILGIAALVTLAAVHVYADTSPAGGGDPGVLPVNFPQGPMQFVEDFDSYAPGSDMHGQGGWKGWDNSPGAGALVSTDFWHTAMNSVNVNGASDLVHEFAGFNSGFWILSAWAYIPSGQSTGQSYFIALNTYNDGGPYNWSTQVCFNLDAGTVVDDAALDCASGATIPLVFDQWAEIRVEIDLTANTQSFFYDGNLLYTDSWTEHVSGGGVANIAALDLFANAATAVYYDDVSLCSDTSCFVPVELMSISIDQ